MGSPKRFQVTTAQWKCKFSKVVVCSILAMVTVVAALQTNRVLTLRDLIIKDTSALRNWSAIVDRIVKESPADQLIIKTLLENGKYAEAVLRSLQMWDSYGQEREDLLAVFRDHGLQTLASDCSHVLGEMKPAHKTGDELWFEVEQVVGSFTGRQSQLEVMHKKLTGLHSQESADKNVVSLSGLGGVGKSTLARKYAFTYRTFYDENVVWINAETVDKMRGSFVRLAKRLGMQSADQLSNEELTANVFAGFQYQKSLFIYDNVENLEDFNTFQPKIVNPSHQAPYVLLTSRQTNLCPLDENEILLDVFEMDEAIELIQKKLRNSTHDAAMKLAQELERLPLALQQALAYIRYEYINFGAEDELIKKYLEDFKTSKAELLNDARFKWHNEYSETTFATWKITLAKIKTISGGESAINIINALAYLNPDLISVHFVRTVFKTETDPGLKLLERFSMISVRDGKVSIHRLVQDVIRLSFSEPTEDEIQRLVTSIRKTFKEDGYNHYNIRECASHGLHLFPFQMKHRHFKNMVTNNYYFHYFWLLCRYLIEYGNYVGALSISKQMATMYQSVYGEKHVSTIMMKCKMADAYSFLEEDSNSLQVINSIFPAAKTTLGTEHWLTMHIYGQLVTELDLIGDYEKALPMYDEYLAVAERVYGENFYNVLNFKVSKALALERLGKLDEALEVLQHVHEKRVSVDREDIITLNPMARIARIHYDKREFSRALKIWEIVEAGRRHVLGDTHPDTVQARRNIEDCKAKLVKSEL